MAIFRDGAIIVKKKDVGMSDFEAAKLADEILGRLHYVKTVK